VPSGFVNDPHSERGNACPRNRFNVTDYAELQLVEAPLVASRIGEMRDRGVTGKFDIPHLQSIHRYLFQDVFPWAGEFRVVNISKGNANFGPAMHIAGALKELFDKLAKENLLTGLAAPAFVERAAFYLGEINAIHPFREGNGRTQREFIRQLGLHAGHPLSWSLVGTGFTQQQMIDASIASHTRGDNKGLATILEAALFSTRAARSSLE
jgi:cell filamentation protein